MYDKNSSEDLGCDDKFQLLDAPSLYLGNQGRSESSDLVTWGSVPWIVDASEHCTKPWQLNPNVGSIPRISKSVFG